MIKMIKGGCTKYILFIVVFYSILFFWKNNFIGRYLSSQISGRVIDISENSPIEMVPVKSADYSTFTNYNGEFVMNTGNRGRPVVKITTPRSYEPGGEEMKCHIDKNSILDRTYYCETFIYPQPFEIAARVLNDDKAVEFQNFKERTDHKKKLWDRSSKLSRESFGTEGDFIFLLSKKEEIDIKKEARLINFDISEEYKTLKEYYDPVIRKNISNVAELQVTRYFSDGSKSETLEHFIREDGIWRYLIPFTRKTIYDFVVNNDWLLKVKN